MGIFGALNTAVSGMRAQSFALENISGNIANSQTPAFKRMDTTFVDLLPDETPTKQLAGSVVANSRMTNTVQGDVQSASMARSWPSMVTGSSSSRSLQTLLTIGRCSTALIATPDVAIFSRTRMAISSTVPDII